MLPEACITGYLSQDLTTNWRLEGWPLAKTYSKTLGRVMTCRDTLDPTSFAETVPGPSTIHFAELSKKLQVYITVPLVEKYWDGILSIM